MINGSKMKKMDVMKWLVDNNYGSTNGFGYCSAMMANAKVDENGCMETNDVYAIIVGSFKRGSYIFRRMQCKVSQFITLERLN